jgi:hypothetical protein
VKNMLIVRGLRIRDIFVPAWPPNFPMPLGDTGFARLPAGTYPNSDHTFLIFDFIVICVMMPDRKRVTTRQIRDGGDKTGEVSGPALRQRTVYL